jgi:hypothetical protein
MCSVALVSVHSSSGRLGQTPDKGADCVGMDCLPNSMLLIKNPIRASQQVLWLTVWHHLIQPVLAGR